MPFKIVKTIEKCKEKLSIVPSYWEEEGLLSWPSRKYGYSKLVKLEYSKPQLDWTKMQCIVKRSSIPTYEKAEEELNVMLNNSDTTDNVDEAEITNSDTIDYNAMATSLTLNQTIIQDQEPLLIESSAGGNNVHLPECEVTNEENIIEICSGLAPNNFEIIENQKLILENQKNIVNNQTIIHETLKQIIDKEEKNSRQMTNLLVFIEDSFTRFNNQPSTVQLAATVNSAENDSFMIKPISNVKELDQLENTLCDKMQKQKIHLQYSLLCSKADGSGINCAYKMLDLIFTREFLYQCSWSGGSKGETVKIAMKGYRNVLNLFFCLIRYWDSTYTIDINEKIFKTVLKNSGKRLEIKNLRASTKRNRGDSKTANKRQRCTAAVIEKGESSEVKDNDEGKEVAENHNSIENNIVCENLDEESLC